MQNFLFSDKPRFGELCVIHNLKLRYNLGYTGVLISP
jgi:hypothetical protein